MSQMESQWIYNPGARTRADITASRRESAEAQVASMVQEEHDAALCDLLREASALSWLLLTWRDGGTADDLMDTLWDALVEQRVAELEEDEEA